MSETQLILHIKGTESGTTELPRQAVRTAISQGQISHSQLIWCPAENVWKQVRQLPHLLPSQKLAPAPPRTPRPVPQPEVAPAPAVIPESPHNPVARAMGTDATPRVRVAATGAPPKVRVAGMAQPTPKVRIATPTVATPSATVAPKVRVADSATAAPAVRVAAVAPARSASSYVVKEDGAESHPLKWICIGLGLFILLVVGGNYLFVDHPLNSRLANTPYANVPVYAHLGAFIQPNVIIIHIPKSATITPDNITGFLSALAQSTPVNPITTNPFDRVALTSGWTAQYSFSGESWDGLAKMDKESDADRKEFIMAQMGDGAGQSLLPASTLSEDRQAVRRDEVWNTFLAHFSAGH